MDTIACLHTVGHVRNLCVTLMGTVLCGNTSVHTFRRSENGKRLFQMIGCTDSSKVWPFKGPLEDGDMVLATRIRTEVDWVDRDIVFESKQGTLLPLGTLRLVGVDYIGDQVPALLADPEFSAKRAKKSKQFVDRRKAKLERVGMSFRNEPVL